MLRRLQLAPLGLGLSLCAWAAISGCQAEGSTLAPGGTLPVATGGASSASSATSSEGGGSTNPYTMGGQGGGSSSSNQGGSSSSNSNQGGSDNSQGGTSANSTTSSNNATGGKATGGTSSSSSATGGSTSSSSTATGGKTSTSSAAGGTNATGGASSTSTATATGGAQNSGTEVTFSNGKAVGAMSGYGFVALGSADTLTSPTCGADNTEITADTECKTTTKWSTTDSLCMSGSIPANDSDPPDYTGNWGVSVGVNATAPDGDGIGQSFASISIKVSGSPTSGLRAIINVGGTDYCYNGMKSGTAIPLTSFNTECWEGGAGDDFAAADSPNIEKVIVQVSSSETADITVKDFCLEGITFK